MPSIKWVTEVSYSNWKLLVHVRSSVLCISTEFLSDRRQRVVVDGGASEWISIISGVPLGSVLGPLLFILYISEMFELVENRLVAYTDESTLLAVVHKSADRPAVVSSFNGEATTNKTTALVVSRSRTVSPPQGDLVLSMVSIRTSPNLDILRVKFNSKLTFEDHVRGIVSRVSQRICILMLMKRIIANNSVHVTSLLFCICSPNPWVLFSGVKVSCWMSPSASWAPWGIFGNQALSLSEFLVVVSSTSCRCDLYVEQG